MAHLLSNIYSKNYWNWTTTVKIITDGWVIYFFGTQCVVSTLNKSLLDAHIPLQAVPYNKPDYSSTTATVS